MLMGMQLLSVCRWPLEMAAQAKEMPFLEMKGKKCQIDDYWYLAMIYTLDQNSIQVCG